MILLKFIGVDVHKDMLTVAEIDANLGINSLNNFMIHEFIEYILKNDISIVAVDAPNGLNLGLMNNEDYRKKVNNNIKGHYNKKVSEYELSRRGINPFSTPEDMSEVIGWKEWMNTGFAVYTKLEELGYSFIDSNDMNRKCNKEVIEVFPHACFTTLLGYIPSKKSTKQGLEQRINLLTQIGFKNVDELLRYCNKHEKTDKLDAIIAAYTAYLTYKEEVTFVGDIKEGQIVLPTKNLMDSYKRLKSNEVKVEKQVRDIVFDKNKKAFEYEYLNVDSVIWFKYFTPLNDSPSIKEIIKFVLSNKIQTLIQNEEGLSVEVILEPLKNGTDGMKVTKEYKEILKNFWGSHGDKKLYKIILNI